MSTSEVPLRLRLCHSLESLQEGTEIRALGGARARLIAGQEPLELAICLPERPLTELRYVLDQVVRSAGKLFALGPVQLAADERIAGDAVLTFALDLHNRAKGRLELLNRRELAPELTRVAAAEDLCRAWVNEDPSTRTSLAIAEDVSRWAANRATVEVEVLAEPELREEKLRLLLAVGRGSEDSPPRLIIARYEPKGATEPPVALVGKGITFDSGGINVKPYASFVSMMKNDMAGAAVAFSLFKTLVEANYPEPLLLVVPSCENAVDARSMRPGAIVETRTGKTVRIDHTDAEGRLILADALAYAQARYQPREFLCFATLTTAALNSYGPYATPVHFAWQELEQRLGNASLATGEDLHFFPERLWHAQANLDEEADLRNTARLPGNASAGAGSRNAAHFLLNFVEAPLCHFDIFASGWNWSGEAPGTRHGATGAPLRTLLRAFARD